MEGMWGFGLSALVMFTSANLPEPDQVVRALRYQYESQLRELRVETARLQNLIAERDRLLQMCTQANDDLRYEVTRAQSASQAALGDELPDFQLDLPQFETDESLFKEAVQNIDSKNYNRAILLLDQIAREYPQSTFADRALFLVGQVYLQRGEARLAEIEFLRLLQDYPKSSKRQKAMEALRSLDHLNQDRKSRRSTQGVLVERQESLSGEKISPETQQNLEGKESL